MLTESPNCNKCINKKNCKAANKNIQYCKDYVEVF